MNILKRSYLHIIRQKHKSFILFTIFLLVPCLLLAESILENAAYTAAALTASFFILLLLLSLRIRSRFRETGILLAAGISKRGVIFQYILECMMIAAVSFFLLWILCICTAGILNIRYYSSVSYKITVSNSHFIYICTISLTIILTASIVSSLPVLLLKPKQIIALINQEVAK